MTSGTISRSDTGTTTLKARLAAGEPLFGLICSMRSAQPVELAGWLGADYVLVDIEHGEQLDLPTMSNLIRAADSAGIPALARVHADDWRSIQEILDCGGAGIFVPHVSTREDAERVVRACKYAPEGQRSVSPVVRGARYGAGTRPADVYEQANANILVGVLVEDRIGVANLHEIMAVPGVDVVWMGTGDLSKDLGVSRDDPAIVGAQQRLLALSKENGVHLFAPLPPGVGASTEERADAVRAAIDEGYRLLGWLDTLILRDTLAGLLAVARDAGEPVAS